MGMKNGQRALRPCPSTFLYLNIHVGRLQHADAGIGHFLKRTLQQLLSLGVDFTLSELTICAGCFAVQPRVLKTSLTAVMKTW